MTGVAVTAAGVLAVGGFALARAGSGPDTTSATALAGNPASAGHAASSAGNAPSGGYLASGGNEAMVALHPHGAGPSGIFVPARVSVPAGTSGSAGASGPGKVFAPGGASGPGKLTLTAAERHACPAAASACVDLPAHLTWLQSDGRLTYGPVRMEPGSGAPGTSHATPLGTWRVQWKAGANYVSTTYNEAMPWATFFAPGGVAFHGGSLTAASHGCVHLSIANAKYFHDHLPIAAEVAVFKA
ncbi:MAG TPA: L,D-transpeptidase [Trebonia sp.]